MHANEKTGGVWLIVVVVVVYPRGGGHHPVGEHEEVQAHQLEDVLKQADDLQSQHVLQREDTVPYHHTITPSHRQGVR